MKKITINLNVVNIPPNILPEGVIPCPRIWILKGKMIGGRFSPYQESIQNAKNLKDGQHMETFELGDNEALNVEAYSWTSQPLNFVSNSSFVMTRTAGSKKDQISKNTILENPGTYDILIDINGTEKDLANQIVNEIKKLGD